MLHGGGKESVKGMKGKGLFKTAAAVSVAVMMLFSFAACGGSGDASGDATGAQETQNGQSGEGVSGGEQNGSPENQDTAQILDMDAVKQIVLERIPGATENDVVEIGFEYDDGRYEYEGTVYYGGYEYEFEVDGETGNILSWEIDD